MKTTLFDQANVYTDLNAVRKLRSEHVDRDEAIRATAKQFESYLTHMMLKSMRQVNAVFEEGNPFHSHGESMFRDLLDHQLSLNMSQRQSGGLAETLARQLGAAPVADEPAQEALSGSDRNLLDKVSQLRMNRPVVESLNPQQQLRLNASAASPTPASVLGPRLKEPSPQEPLSPAVRFDNPEDFVASVYPAAAEVAKELGVDPAVLVAQSALETGWGRHMIEGPDGQPSFNLFGIKADSRWQGEAVTVTTHEYHQGVKVREQAPFRAYDSFADSFRDYLGFIRDQGRYSQALAAASEPGAYARELQKAGYATDPAYAEKIDRIYQSETVQRARLAWQSAPDSATRVDNPEVTP